MNRCLRLVFAVEAAHNLSTVSVVVTDGCGSFPGGGRCLALARPRCGFFWLSCWFFSAAREFRASPAHWARALQNSKRAWRASKRTMPARTKKKQSRARKANHKVNHYGPCGAYGSSTFRGRDFKVAISSENEKTIVFQVRTLPCLV